MAGIIDPQSDFADMCRQAAAEEWGKRAADRAKAAGKRGDTYSLSDWLDQSETDAERQLRSSNPESWQSLRDDAAARAEMHARLNGIWRD